MKHLLQRRWSLGLSVIMFALVGAGVAVAARQSASSDVTSVCVNDTNGLMRASTACREGEHSLTIGGGGGNARVTQGGTFSVVWGDTGGARVLPLTGVTVSGRCEVFPLPMNTGEGANARLLVEAPTGRTMDVFPIPNGNGIGVSSALLAPVSSFFGGPAIGGGTQYAILTANGATATITAAGFADPESRTCKFLWQAVEAAN